MSDNSTKCRNGGDLSFWFLPDVSKAERSRADHSPAPAKSRMDHCSMYRNKQMLVLPSIGVTYIIPIEDSAR